MTRVVAGAGVAAVECVLALRDLAGSRVEIELLAPAAELVHRPSSVAMPFGATASPRIDVRRLGLEQHREALAAVDPGAREVVTRGGDRLPYDVLVVATGAPSRDALAGAVTFRGAANAGAVEGVLALAVADPELRIAFAAPAGATWMLPLYELALLSAATLRGRAVEDPDLLVVTGEDQPLALLGAPATEALLGELDRHGIDVVTRAAAAFATESALKLHDGRLVRADAVVALPELVGPRIDGLPHDDAGFVPVDDHGRVYGLEDVYAAGDATTVAIKHGGVATQQADAVAEAIAERVGAIATATAFEPILRGVLMTGAEPLYVRADGARTVVSREPLWSPPDKIAGRYLSPYLATGATDGATLTEPDAPRARELRLR